MMRGPQLLICLLMLLAVPAASAQERNAARGQRPAPPASSQQPTGPPGVITDPSFPARLGAAVGMPTTPAMPPGVGNINHPGTIGTPSTPGMQPLPTATQPLPIGIPGYPNINFPGGMPGSVPSNPPKNDGRDGRGRFPTPGVVYYGVPYYVPYYVYSAPGTNAVYPDQLGAAPAASAVTLLAFKDHTVLAVTDYWLEGDQLYYETAPGLRASVPLDRLDLTLTQQLNRERGVRFVLEARP